MKQTLHIICIIAMLSFLLVQCRKDALQDTVPSQTNNQLQIENITATTAATGSENYDQLANVPTASGWTEVFTENFTDPQLPLWKVWYGGAYNYELQLYQRENLVVENGMLKINAKREPATGPTLPTNSEQKSFNFTSGRIESIKHFSASNSTPKVRMAARIKLPKGHGMWPAFWSYGDPWPTQGEIDIMEARGDAPYVYHTAYWYGRRPGTNTTSGTENEITSTVSLSDYFHVYEMIWSKNTLSFYFDGVLVETKSGGNIPKFFGKSERVTLNLAVGGGFFGNTLVVDNIPSAATMEVDWVKVLTSK